MSGREAGDKLQRGEETWEVKEGDKDGRKRRMEGERLEEKPEGRLMEESRAAERFGSFRKCYTFQFLMIQKHNH